MGAKTTPQLVYFATLCIIFLHALTLIKADEGLITQLCSATSSPDACKECLESDPSGKTAIKIGLVEISMVCATNKMDTLYQDTFRNQGNASDPAIKKALNFCLDQFENARFKVNHVSDLVKQGDFNTAKQVISDQVVKQVFSCKAVLESQWPVSSVISNEMDVDFKYWNIVSGILGSPKSKISYRFV